MSTQTLQVIEDRHQRSFLATAGASGLQKPVRRPTRGIQLKPETFATLKVVGGNGDKRWLIDAGGREEAMRIGDKRATDIYSNFFIQQVQEDRAEKQQILETFGEPYIFFFGERARVITFQGILLNTWDFNWEAEWWENYESYLRGTRCVENDARVYLQYDETLVGGYILNTAAAKDTNNPHFVNFTFSMFVTNYTNWARRTGDPSALPPGVRPAWTDTGDAKVVQTTRQMAALARPKLLSEAPFSEKPTRFGPKLNSLTLADGLRGKLDAVIDTWRRAQNLVRVTVQNTKDQAVGIIRVPVGYEGSLVFEDGADVELIDVDGHGVTRFTTYKDNLDEYVGGGYGPGSHYESANPAALRLPLDWDQEDRDYGKTLVKKAMNDWLKVGMVPPLNQLGTLVSTVQEFKGLRPVGRAQDWESGKKDGPIQLANGTLLDKRLVLDPLRRLATLPPIG